MGAIAATAAATAGCTEGPNGPTDNGFVSDSPFGSGQNGGGDDVSAEGGDTTTETGTENGGDPEKAIIEADIVQVDGDRLFALSQYTGLSIVDMSNPGDLQLVGNHRMQGIPFEMYLQGNVAYAMFSSWGKWECDEDWESCTYVTSSHIEALDVSDPANIVQIGSFDMPGEISDSRIVGSVLYAVTYENGYCWNCQEAPQTVVTSIDVGDPADIAVVDTVSFSSADPNGWGWRRSVSVTPDRMFIAGIEWNGDGDGHSTIQVVDISDPDGLLHVGASVQAHGQIESRWQMDEKDGVLRVISQPGVWWTDDVPQVQTFQIQNSDSLVPLGTLNLTLPQPERMRAARFDGTRLYAITAEQTDPLFTIDLTDPAQPAQLAALEIPGWIYHLEPRGDRLFALGFDNQNPDGAMNVSLFDVADMNNPILLERVAFGGDWAWVNEDQDRVHKAFKIDSELGAIFVPFGAYDWSEDDGYGCSTVTSGVQIIDFTQDGLAKRGMAPLHGLARRALVHEGNLYTVSDSEVAAYDIANRDAPAQLDALALSAWVNQSVRVGDKVVRIAADWWSNAAQLDVVPANDASRTQALGSLDLAEIVTGPSDCYGFSYFYGARLFALDSSRVAVVWSTYDWNYSEESPGSTQEGSHVAVINVSNASQPQLEGLLDLPFAIQLYGWWYQMDGGQDVVKIGNRLVFRRIQYPEWNSDEMEKAWLEVVDVTDPSDPTHLASVQLPDGFGHSLLVKNGNQVLTSHWAPVPDLQGKVKFYLDRAVFPVLGAPELQDSINVPGALLSFDPATGHVLTIDFHRVNAAGGSWESCQAQYGWGSWYDETTGTCHYMEQVFKLVDIHDDNDVEVLDAEIVDGTFYVYGSRVTETRVFVQGYKYSPQDGYGHSAVLAIGDIGEDTIQTAIYESPIDEWMWPVAADGEDLVLSSYSSPGIHVLDASDLDAMTMEKKADVTAYVYSAQIDGDKVLCSMGPYGLEVVDLD